jgi:RNA polymerase sigma-70 factor (ECF subfamily)
MEVWEEIEANPERGAQRLIDEYGNRLYAAADILCPDQAEAEDLVFRTLAQAVRKIAQYRGKAPFFSWLYRIMLNFRRMDCRGKDVELVFAETLPEPHDSSMEDVESLLASVDADTVRKAVRRLSPVLREAVLLRYFEDRSIAEMAEILDVPQGTVMSRLFNARAVLHGILAGEGPAGKGETK